MKDLLATLKESFLWELGQGYERQGLPSHIWDSISGCKTLQELVLLINTHPEIEYSYADILDHLLKALEEEENR